METAAINNLFFSDNRERTDRLVNNLRVGVMLHGPGSEIIFSNKAASDLLGLTADQLNGRSCFDTHWDAIREDGSPFAANDLPVIKAINSKKTIENVVLGLLTTGNTGRTWLLVNAEPILDDSGCVKEVICSFSDITERKIAEEKLTWLYQDLEARAFELATSTADLEKFVYAATHDLQEPLRMVGSFVQLLKKKYEQELDEQAREYIDYAVEGAKRMKKLILDLLEYSRFSSSDKKMVSTNTGKILEELRASFSNSLHDMGARLVVHPLPTVFADPRLIRQLFENLIDNAIKYRSESHALLIEVNCVDTSDEYCFEIKDNGIGINPTYSAKIFDLFKRLHHSGEYEGTGVGLAICKKIVNLHRGEIGVRSGTGNGSTFYFTIPKTKEEAHEEL